MKKILILSANPHNTSQLRLDEEVREIQSALSRSRSRGEFQLITRGAIRINDLRRALLDEGPQIVHFSGHGLAPSSEDLNTNQQQTGEREAVYRHSQLSGIVLEDDFGQVQLVSTNALTKLFELFKDKVECVLLNACYSEFQASAIYEYIDCVIGMNNTVPDQTAIKFSVGFYDAVGAGRTYADAFKFGRNNIDINNIPGDLIPVIKTRNQSQTLFPLNSKEKKADMASDGRTINMGSGNYNEKIHGNYVQGNYSTGGENQSLTDVAAEIQKLLSQLGNSYSPNTTLGKMQIASEIIKSIENSPTLTAQVLSALNANGIEALRQLINHPAASFVISALQDWQTTKSSQTSF